ncbi:MAG: septum formation protein [Oceanicoccus sp.]|jgi:septum formation protein
MRKIVLASASPRRKKILRDIGLSFAVDPALEYTEIHPENHDPESLVAMNAVGKAREIAEKHKDSLVIGVDTIGVFEGEVLEKPLDREDAKRMIMLLQGETHEVKTAICLIDTKTKKELTEVETTKIKFLSLTEKEVDNYLDKGESMDKAAAYAAQGKAALFIEGFEGDYLNVVGLPLVRLNLMLQEFDFHLLDVVK